MLGHRRLTLALAALVAAACGRGDGGDGGDSPVAGRARAAGAACEGASTLAIDSRGVGPVRLGRRVADIAADCTVADTAISLGEGIAERAHVVRLGARSVVALSTGTPDTSVTRVILDDEAFRTDAGVGVGSTVEGLRAAHGPVCSAMGEGIVVVFADGIPGVSFAIDWRPSPRGPIGDDPLLGDTTPSAVSGARITRIWVHGETMPCRRSANG